VVMAETQPGPSRDGGGVGVAAASLLVGRYRLKQVLGGGGMAQVYQARDERLDRPVAVKVFRSEAGVSSADLREQTEIRLLASLHHPGLVAVFDAGTDQPGTAGQRSFLVLELVAGMTLAQRIATGPLPTGEVGEIGKQLATALTYVHEHGVVHGPCRTAIWEREPVHIPDMATEDRWPRFAAAATEAGVGAMLCFQLFVHGDNLGALNLYAPTAHAFTDESQSIGLVFAAHAAVALAAAQHEQHLHTALAHRDIIGQAKGIVMERFHLDADQAFALLARLSQEANTKLHDVAARIAADASTPPTV